MSDLFNYCNDPDLWKESGKRIEARRKELGISQRDLADKCGVPHSSVARIEACVVKPNVETIIKIMKPLGLTLSVSQL